ncbi:MAG: SGNH/GDSL hydrolase family protein, partial [Candidatus Wallbacteria bacterium]|nr:SGNH/GDSL hydrolase family protein [Candidatus Wallbacteria bacterium]
MNVGADGNSQAAARPGWAKRLVFSALAIASILAMIELGLRGQRAWQDWRASGQGPIKPSGDVYRTHPFVYLVPTPGRYVDSQGYEETINSRGFRGPEVAVPKPAGVFRIACLGASTTIGTYQRRDRDTYPAVLERLLREARPGARVEVVNAGIAGAASAQNATNFLARVVPLEPDGIVLYDNYNDLKWATPSVFRDDWSHLQVETQ